MVHLTMTPSIVDGLKKAQGQRNDRAACDGSRDALAHNDDPTLTHPEVGNPISHGQILELWKDLKATEHSAQFSLERLLQSSYVYIPPPPPKAEPSDQYKALMAKLRRDEEQRSYEQMVNPPARLESSQNRFTNDTHTFAEVNRPISTADIGDDEVTYSDVHRQVMLIINFIASIVGVAATLWVLARWWSTPARLFLTMGGSILVGIAEVVVYSGYMWRMGESKQKEDKVKELKQVVHTWTVSQDGVGELDQHKGIEETLLRTEDDGGSGVRKRVAAKMPAKT